MSIHRSIDRLIEHAGVRAAERLFASKKNDTWTVISSRATRIHEETHDYPNRYYFFDDATNERVAVTGPAYDDLGFWTVTVYIVTNEDHVALAVPSFRPERGASRQVFAPVAFDEKDKPVTDAWWLVPFVCGLPVEARSSVSAPREGILHAEAIGVRVERTPDEWHYVDDGEVWRKRPGARGDGTRITKTRFEMDEDFYYAVDMNARS